MANTHDGHSAEHSLQRHGTEQKWLLTGWDDFGFGDNEGVNPYEAYAPRHPGISAEVGAKPVENIDPNAQNVHPVADSTLQQAEFDIEYLGFPEKTRLEIATNIANHGRHSAGVIKYETSMHNPELSDVQFREFVENAASAASKEGQPYGIGQHRTQVDTIGGKYGDQWPVPDSIDSILAGVHRINEAGGTSPVIGAGGQEGGKDTGRPGSCPGEGTEEPLNLSQCRRSLDHSDPCQK